jgi:hypothetical protein
MDVLVLAVLYHTQNISFGVEWREEKEQRNYDYLEWNSEIKIG